MLTKEQILKMQAGAEMNGLVDELMGKPWHFQCPKCYGEYFHTWDMETLERDCKRCQRRWANDECRKIQDYSDSIGYAWTVFEKTIELTVDTVGTMTITRYRDTQPDGGNWCVKLGLDGYNGSFEPIWWASAPTIELAICRTALLIKLETTK